MYLAPVIFIFTCLLYAYYSFCQIKLGTSTLWWHLAQWFSVAGFVLAGWVWGKVKEWDWHKFGRSAGIACLSVLVYVYSLHFMLKWFNEHGN